MNIHLRKFSNYIMEDEKETLNIGKNCWEELANALEEGSKIDDCDDNDNEGCKVFHPWERDDPKFRLYLKEDSDLVEKIYQDANDNHLEDKNTGTAPGIPEKFYFCLEPTPWVGGWKKVIPKIAILSLNPGIKEIKDENKKPKEWVNFDDSFKNKDKRKAYQELWANNLRGEVTFADVLFRTAEIEENGGKKIVHLWGREGREYWIEHLLPLYMSYTGKEISNNFKDELLKKSRAEIEDNETFSNVITFFDQIITIELFPYHSLNGKGIKDLENYKNGLNDRQKFTKNLVNSLLESGTKIIITRGASKWEELVPKLKDKENEIILLSSIRNTCITENNCYTRQRGCFKTLVDALNSK